MLSKARVGGGEAQRLQGQMSWGPLEATTASEVACRRQGLSTEYYTCAVSLTWVVRETSPQTAGSPSPTRRCVSGLGTEGQWWWQVSERMNGQAASGCVTSAEPLLLHWSEPLWAWWGPGAGGATWPSHLGPEAGPGLVPGELAPSFVYLRCLCEGRLTGPVMVKGHLFWPQSGITRRSELPSHTHRNT